MAPKPITRDRVVHAASQSAAKLRAEVRAALAQGGAAVEGRAKKNKTRTTYFCLGQLSALKTVPTYLFFYFFSNFFYCGFGCFSAWGTQKQRKNFFGNFLVMTQKATS